MRRPPAVLESLESQLLRLAGDLEYANRCLAALFEERQDLRLVLKDFDLSDVKEIPRTVGEAYWRGYRDGYADGHPEALPSKIVLSPEDYAAFEAEVLGPSAPNPALRDLFRNQERK